MHLQIFDIEESKIYVVLPITASLYFEPVSQKNSTIFAKFSSNIFLMALFRALRGSLEQQHSDKKQLGQTFEGRFHS